MPNRHTPLKINGATEDGRSMPAARPQAATAPRYLVIERTLASVVEPTLSIPPAQRSLASGFAGPESWGRSLTSAPPARPETLQVVGLRRPPGGCDDVIAELRQQRRGDRTDAARGAGDGNR